MRRRSWRWLQTKIAGLVDMPPTFTPDGDPIPATRIGWVLNPPKGATSQQ